MVIFKMDLSANLTCSATLTRQPYLLPSSSNLKCQPSVAREFVGAGGVAVVEEAAVVAAVVSSAVAAVEEKKGGRDGRLLLLLAVLLLLLLLVAVVVVEEARARSKTMLIFIAVLS